MSALALWLAAALVAAETPKAGPRSACVECHLGLEGKDPKLAAPARLLGAEDVHAASGFGCHDCHGGNPLAASGGKKASHDEGEGFGFLGAPDPTAVPGICARCHADADFMRTYDPRLRVDQLAVRRRGLAVALVFILLSIVGVWLKIRDLER